MIHAIYTTAEMAAFVLVCVFGVGILVGKRLSARSAWHPAPRQGGSRGAGRTLGISRPGAGEIEVECPQCGHIMRAHKWPDATKLEVRCERRRYIMRLREPEPAA